MGSREVGSGGREGVGRVLACCWILQSLGAQRAERIENHSRLPGGGGLSEKTTEDTCARTEMVWVFGKEAFVTQHCSLPRFAKFTKLCTPFSLALMAALREGDVLDPFYRSEL